jgi:phosphoglycerol transferase MdoB-like AlkP superfamily enzyme
MSSKQHQAKMMFLFLFLLLLFLFSLSPWLNAPLGTLSVGVYVCAFINTKIACVCCRVFAVSPMPSSLCSVLFFFADSGSVSPACAGHHGDYAAHLSQGMLI